MGLKIKSCSWRCVYEFESSLCESNADSMLAGSSSLPKCLHPPRLLTLDSAHPANREERRLVLRYVAWTLAKAE